MRFNKFSNPTHPPLLESRPKKFQNKPQADGQKGRGSGVRNFSPSASPPQADLGWDRHFAKQKGKTEKF